MLCSYLRIFLTLGAYVRKLKQNANKACNSCASLAGLALSFIACFILLVIAPLRTLFGYAIVPGGLWLRPIGLVKRSADVR